MEQKKINLSIIFSLALFAIGIASKNLLYYFSGFGIAFIGVLVFAILIVVKGVINKESRRRLYDIFILAGISIILSLVTYCSFDWAKEIDYNFMQTWCNIYSVFSLIFFVYATLRLISELSEKKWVVFDYILFLKKADKKVKINEKYSRQPKEVMNGDLEQKPNQAETANESIVVENSEAIEQPEDNNQNNNF